MGGEERQAKRIRARARGGMMNHFKYSEALGRMGTETSFLMGMRVAELERQGRKLIKFHIGQPDFPTPEHVKHEAIKWINQDYTGYTESNGIYDLREAIAQHITKTRGVEIDPAEVVVTPGAKMILFGAALMLLNPGDEGVYPNPGYPIYESAIDITGAKSVPVILSEENGFCFEHEKFKALVNKKTKLIYLNSPSNPTGEVLTKNDLKLVRDLAVDNDIVVLSDEIYSRILYEGKHESIISMPGMKERTILVDGFSKIYAMTGWRLGYGVMPKELAKHMTNVAINIYSCPTSFVQKAGIAALNGPQTASEKMVAEFKRRREAMVEGLNEIEGVTCTLPKGAFYVFPNVKHILRKGKMKSSVELMDKLLMDAGIATLSGTYFGKYGEGYLRLSYAASMENIKKGLEVMKAYVEKL